MTQLGGDACLRAERCCDGVAGDERELWPQRHRRSWPEQHREEETAAGRRLPDPSEPAAPMGLVIGGDRRSLYLVAVEQALGRGALLDEPVRASEATLQQRLDRVGREI